MRRVAALRRRRYLWLAALVATLAVVAVVLAIRSHTDDTRGPSFVLAVAGTRAFAAAQSPLLVYGGSSKSWRELGAPASEGRARDQIRDQPQHHACERSADPHGEMVGRAERQIE